jgi:MFS family permease
VISGVSVGLLTAGAVSPRVGRAIGKWGGRRVLALSAVLLAGGLLLLGTSQSIAWYLTAWLLIGAGMGSGLTDAAFSTLGSIYGEDARSPITSLTLFAGFASTLCWPLSAYLVERQGWRGACFIYAAIQIGVALPILLLALPGRSFIAPSTDHEGARSRASLAPGELPIFALLAVVLTLSAAILSMLGIHLLPLLVASSFRRPSGWALLLVPRRSVRVLSRCWLAAITIQYGRWWALQPWWRSVQGCCLRIFHSILSRSCCMAQEMALDPSLEALCRSCCLDRRGTRY